MHEPHHLPPRLLPAAAHQQEAAAAALQLPPKVPLVPPLQQLVPPAPERPALLLAEQRASVAWAAAHSPAPASA